MRPQAKRSKRWRVRRLTGLEKSLKRMMYWLATHPRAYENIYAIQTKPSEKHWLQR